VYTLPSEEWSKTYDNNIDVVWSVQQTSDGGYIIVGETRSFDDDDFDVYLVKTDSDGDMLWNRTFGGDGWDRGYYVQQTNDGGYIIVGETHSFSAGYGDIYLVKTDSDGDMLWNKTYGGTQSDYGYCVQQTNDGGYIITGGGWDDVYLVKTDSDGDMLWNKTYGGTQGDDSGRSVRQTSDGGYIIAGSTESFSARWFDVYLIKLASADTTPPVANAGNDQTVIVDKTVIFDAGSSSDDVGIVRYEWDFGDGNTGTGITTTHTYSEVKIYTVTLKVMDAAGYSDTDTIIVTTTVQESFPIWVIGVLSAIVIVAIAVVYLIRKRKK
jgi:hypothetical protein